MKKLIMAAVIACVAVASHAYEIKWGARNMFIPVATDAKTSQTGIIPTSGDKFAAGALTVSLFWVSTEGDVKIGDYTTTGSGVISAQTLADGTDSDLYKAMLADQGGDWKPTYHYTATYATADGVYAFSGTSSASSPLSNLASGSISLTSDFKTTGSWTYTANPVPEPTSAMLLLLGVAGLALRRRRA